jgi:dTMP kinase
MESVRNAQRGLFIVMEGMDGSGKSVGAQVFEQFLKDEGLNLITTREVGGTRFGEEIRKLIFDSKNPVDPMARFMAILAARQQHVKEVIMPNIEKGISVLSDRFNDTTFVYQGVVDGLMSSYYELQAMRGLTSIFRRADITVFFSVDPKIAYERGTARVSVDNDQYKRGLDTAVEVARGYQLVVDRLSQEQRKNFFTINGNQSMDQVKDDLRELAKHIVLCYKDPQQ